MLKKLKKVSLALMVCLMLLPSMAKAQTFSVNYKDAPIVQVLTDLESKSSYTFVYQKQELNGIAPITVSLNNMEFTDVLGRICQEAGLSYEIVRQTVVLRKGIASKGKTASLKVSGKITALDDNTPIAFASIMVKGTKNIAAANENGEFAISNVPSDGTLEISSIGYTTQNVAVNNRQIINVNLKTDAQLLEETIVVAYGTAKKGSITGSAAVVDDKKIEQRISANVAKSIEGQVAGVMVTSGSGAPGEGNDIVIRGYGSINASKQPLYVVDGIPYDGGLNAINPNDIESITILKDASSGALYGARGANGVVMITTKKGKAGKATVTYTGTVGWSNPALKYYDRVNQKDWTQLNYESLRNKYWDTGNYSWEEAATMAKKNMSETMGGEIYNPFKNYTWDNIIGEDGLVRADAVSAWNEDWLDDGVVRHNALRTEHLLSVTGGTDKTKAMLSLGYLNEDGYVNNAGYTRFSGRANVDSEITHWLAAGLNVSLAKTDFKGILTTGNSYGNQFFYAQLIGPIYPIYAKDENGRQVYDDLGKKVYDYGDTRPSWPGWNVVGLIYEDDNSQEGMNESVRTYLRLGTDRDDAGWLKGLKLTANFGGDNRDIYQTRYNNMYNGSYADANGRLYKYFKRTTSYTFNQLLTYNRTFSGHTIDFVGGHESYKYVYHYLDATKSNLTDGIYELRPATSSVDCDSYSNEYAIESYLTRINYDYKNRYYFSASFRRDGSSRFHKDRRWGNFWSVGANWRITNESFMQSLTWLDNLNFRVSYGVQGNDDLSTYYAWQSFYELGHPNDGAQGAVVSSLENMDVTWEKNSNLNIGLDARLLGGRLDFTVEYYNRVTKDMLLNYPMAVSTGFSGYDANVGSLENKGIEFSIRGILMDRKNFTWKASIMGTSIKNKILKLTTESPSYISGQQIYEEGRPMYTFYMVKHAGVDPETGKEQFWAYESMDEKGNPVGEYKTTDFAVATGCKYYLGSRMPKLTGSIGTDFEICKYVDISILTTYSLGGKVYDQIYKELIAPTQTGRALSTYVLDRWQKPGDVTDVPRAELGGSSPISSRLLIDASYFSIKNITVGFNFPKEWIQPIKAQQLRVYASFDNYWTFTHLNGMNPQQSIGGTTNYVYNPTKTSVIGLKVTF